MSQRNEHLQRFIDAAFVSFDRYVKDPEGRRSIVEICRLLEHPEKERQGDGTRPAVCDFLSSALCIRSSDSDLLRMLKLFRRVEPKLEWRRRAPFDQTTASENFADGHANAMIIGPGGLEEREDLWLGVTLLAPHVRYPDHNHAPEETYLVLSEGEFRQGEGHWFSPGIGGSFYNLPHIKHAMRSVDTPLLAFWALLAERPR